MKRIISLTVAILMIVSAFALQSVFAVTHGYLYGDANDDTEINMKDVLLIRRAIAGLEPLY